MKTMGNMTVSILCVAILLVSWLISPTMGAITTPSTTSSSLGVFYYSWGGGNAEVSPTGTWRYWSDDGHNPPSTSR